MKSAAFDEGNLTASDGTQLFFRRALLERARANVILVHGLGEHSARYLHVAEFFAARGFRLCAFDMRGHGRSQGKRGDLESYGQLLDDVESVWRHFAEPDAGVPAFLYGHSLGAQIALHFARQRQPRLCGAVIASPWLQLAFEPRAWKLFLARVALRVWPQFSQTTGMRTERLSRDLPFLASMRDLDLVHHRMSARMFFFLKEAAASAMRDAREFDAPLLMIHGAADPVTSAAATERFFRAVPARDKTLKLYPGTLHETHNDLNRDEVLGDIAVWLEAHCPAPVPDPRHADD